MRAARYYGGDVSRAESFAPLDPVIVKRWSNFAGRGREVPLFPEYLGLQIEELRTDYCRMRMPYRAELEQFAGLVHGGALSALLDTVVVPAIGQAYGKDAQFSTVDLHVQYLSALRQDDAVAEGWIVRRGRSTVFCEAEARAASTAKPVARAILTYAVSPGEAGDIR